MRRVVAFRMPADALLRAVMELALADPASMAAMPEAQRFRAWRDELFDRFQYGADTFPYVAFDADAAKPLALYWAEVSPAGVAFVHQFVLPAERRGFTAVRAARACARRCLMDFPSVSALMGLTPEENRAAVAVARRAGFMDMGRVGVCRLLVAERDVFTKGAHYGR